MEGNSQIWIPMRRTKRDLAPDENASGMSQGVSSTFMLHIEPSIIIVPTTPQLIAGFGTIDGCVSFGDDRLEIRAVVESLGINTWGIDSLTLSKEGGHALELDVTSQRFIEQTRLTIGLCTGAGYPH
jgi:hypothetical protein